MKHLCKSEKIKTWPAIDLLGGEVVRLYQGAYNKVTSYAADPLKVAEQFEAAGAKYLHIVDLDAARRGVVAEKSNNRGLIRRICEMSSMEVEAGGGIRSDDDVRELVEAGVKRLVLGTVLVRSPELAAAWVERFEGAEVDFIAGIDARDSVVKIAGWESSAGMRAEELAAGVAALGMKGIVYTNISKDGTLQGPDIDGSLRIARAAGLPVTISGGMGSLEDCRRIAGVGAGAGQELAGCIDGVIIGKALYEGSINLEEAIEIFDARAEQSFSADRGQV